MSTFTKPIFSTQRLNVFKATIKPSQVNMPRDFFFACRTDVDDCPMVVVSATCWVLPPSSALGAGVHVELIETSVLHRRCGLAKELWCGIAKYYGVSLQGQAMTEEGQFLLNSVTKPKDIPPTPENGFLAEGGKIIASYPSGRIIEGTGRLFVFNLPKGGGCCPMIHDPADPSGQATILDPRALISVDGKVRYHPRAFGPLLAEWGQEWLKETPTWCPVAGMKGQHAPGAMPAGTRVRKAVWEPGEAHQIGDLGVVEGSMMAKDDLVYSVLWDDNPDVPVACDEAMNLENLGEQ